ncbi:uncharacterized protein F5891DRAFT_984850 [Suillus fuscotomentosus]|uniref:Uncharacterized protein n=1 Tax=Suillus fuscotomentosus TaxID=1912939 RepID=A0AAD4DXJ0_9AGAM|nr:uncharacterized protein F5891DRAFT_984850 [Suillus fuscotomentosus]KAG1894694.1 hypothetical protein F5891DRAFT_984850 [Suillus fuscotomentosus]
MDDLLLQYHNLVNDGEETGFLDDEEDARMLAATLVAGIELARLDRVKTRNPKRLYLCRAHLLPDPHRNTPWQVLYASHSDLSRTTLWWLQEYGENGAGTAHLVPWPVAVGWDCVYWKMFGLGGDLRHAEHVSGGPQVLD